MWNLKYEEKVSTLSHDTFIHIWCKGTKKNAYDVVTR